MRTSKQRGLTLLAADVGTAEAAVNGLPGLVSRRNAEAAMWATATPQRKRIWRSAQPRPRGDGHGWDHRSRRQRYESLRSRTTV